MDILTKLKNFIAYTKFFKNWHMTLLDNFNLVKSGSVTYYLRNGITLEKSELGLINEIWLLNNYTPSGFEINENDTIIDIGAHKGVFSVFAAVNAKNGSVYSYEANSINFGILSNNAKMNNLTNLHPSHNGISGKMVKKAIYF